MNSSVNKKAGIHQCVFALLLAATSATQVLAAEAKKRIGGVDSIDASYAETVTKTWNPQFFPAKGHLVYAAQAEIPSFLLPYLKGLGNILVFRPVNLDKEKTSVYRLRLGPPIYDVQAAPNGRNLLLKAGELSEPGTGYGMHLWDWQKKPDTTPRLSGSNFPKVVWSADSNYLASHYNRFDSRGNETSRSVDVYDVKLDRTQEIKVPFVGTGAAFTKRNALLLNRTNPKNPTNNDGGPYPTLHEIEIGTAKPKSKLIVENAEGPIAESPDGRWIAFQGWPHPSDSNEKIVINGFSKVDSPDSATTEGRTGQGKGLYLFDRIAKKRYLIANLSELLLNGGFGSLTYLRWSPDRHKLIATASSVFFDVDLVQRRVRRLANIGSAEQPKDAIARTYPDFDLLAFSPDNAVLLVKTAEWKDTTDVQTIDIKSGALNTVARIEKARGVAWISEQPSDNK